jgi:tRNA1Val (adenine37-N6)-methyltransferase
MKVGTDSVLLGSWATVNPNQHILDIGTGTGLLSIMLAQKVNGKCTIDAIEIEEGSLKDASVNISECPWSECIKLHFADFNKFTGTTLYDVIISNPPFYEGAYSDEPSRNVARSARSNLSFEQLLTGANSQLKWEGKMYMILPFEVLKKIEVKARKLNLYIIDLVSIKPSPKKPANRVMIELLKTSTIQHQINQTLIIKQDATHYSKEFISLTKDYYLDL